MAKINDDVLRLFLDFIEVDALDSIASAHPVFHEARMASRYATVRLNKRDRDSKRFIAHLSQEWVGRHVKSVAIQPWLVDPRTKSPRSKTENAITRCMEILDPHYTKKKAEQRLQKRLTKDTVRVQNALEVMKNVQEYIIEWDGDPNYHPEFYHAFVLPPLEAWSSHLISLSICLPPSTFNSLARVRLPHLETLSVQFDTGNLSESDTMHLYDGFIVFINNLKDSLTSLKVSSTCSSLNLNLSRIFRRMGTFPRLRKISLSIPFDGGHLPDPLAFADFVAKHHSSLKDLSIVTSRCTAHSKTGGDPEHVNWIQHILTSFHIPFPRLTAFEVALRPLRGPLDTLGHFIDMHSTTLQSLSLADRGLDVMDLQRLFLSPHMAWDGLHELRFKAQTVTAPLLTCIAHLLPDLKACSLESADVDFEHPSFVPLNLVSSKGGVPVMAECSTPRSIERDRHALIHWGLQRLVINTPQNLHSSDKAQHQMCLLKDKLGAYLPGLNASLFCKL
ncbi:hypothetical protein D9619_010602 [Psilocybe cf. subviscida]|uniref:Uncharacterized protein n=1 Tax=Psilocybe cf. subviscida TaxID=2480587 RepID=A0A8H5AS60_9AGAR|nr:hypothetical protein D9619_010602 [Psilocybe cf. subviscida]